MSTSRKRWLLLYAVAITAAIIAGFNDHGLIPGLPSSIIGSILNQLVKTVGLLGVGDMVLYFRAKEDLDREREDHQRTKAVNESLRAENEELRAAQRERWEAEEAAWRERRDAEAAAWQERQEQRDAEVAAWRERQERRDAEEAARRDAEAQERAAERALYMEHLRLLGDEIRELRAQRNGNSHGNGNGVSSDPDESPA